MKAHVEATQSLSAVSSRGTHSGSGRSIREGYAQSLAIELTALAGDGRIDTLAQRLGSVPLWGLLAIRAIIVESGAYPRLVDALIKGLQHPKSTVRYICAHALDRFGDDRSAEPLRRLLHDPVPRVRRVALHSLGCTDCKLAPLQSATDVPALAIDLALNDSSINVRRHATTALGMCSGDPRATEALQMLLARETDVAILRNARRALRCLQIAGAG